MERKRARAYTRLVQTLLFVLILLAAGGALVSVVRGVIAMLRAGREDLAGTGLNRSGLQQNRMMWRRVQFQTLTIILVILFLLVAHGHAG